MNKRKRILSFGAAFAIGITSAATVLTACAPPPSEDIFVREDLAAQINADIPKDTTASIRVGIRATNAEEKIMNGLIEAFNEEYRHITVTPVRVSGDAYDTTLSSYIPAGTMHDLFWVNPPCITITAFRSRSTAISRDRG